MPIWRPSTVRTLAPLVVVASVVSCSTVDLKPENEIEPAELAARLSSDTPPVILDVRTPAEFAEGHLPGAVNIPHDQLAGRLASLELPATAEIVVHCRSGRRAGLAESLLRESGYKNVRELRGHMQAWRGAGYPVE